MKRTDYITKLTAELYDLAKSEGELFDGEPRAYVEWLGEPDPVVPGHPTRLGAQILHTFAKLDGEAIADGISRRRSTIRASHLRLVQDVGTTKGSPMSLHPSIPSRSEVAGRAR